MMGNFANVLKELRTRSGFSQQELANTLGVSRSSISMFERGEREPNIEILELIADYFNVDMNYLLGNSNYTTNISQPAAGYYINPEVAAYAQEIYDNPELRILMDATRDVTKEDLEFITQMVMKLKQNKND